MSKNQIFEKKAVRHVAKPWGYELIWGHTERYVGKVLHVTRGESLSLQYHEMKDETLYVIKGRVRLELRHENGQEIVMLEPGDSFHIPPRLIHRIAAEEDSDIMEVSTPELDDVIRLEDRYGRISSE